MYNSATLAETAFASRHSAPKSARPRGRLATYVTGTFSALALVVATAAPAHADRNSDNLAKALIAALAIGAIVNSANHHNRPAPAPVPQPRPRPVPQPLPEPAYSPRVPAVCAIEFAGQRRSVTLYPETCLRREGFDFRLPRHCATEARVYGRWDRVYAEDCLRDAGFRIQGDRHQGNSGHRDWRRDDDEDFRRHDRDHDRRRWQNSY